MSHLYVFPSAAYTVEKTAVLGALELLLPYEKLKDIRDMLETGCSCLQIAESYFVPEALVELRLRRDIKNLFNKAYKELSLPIIL
jgi:hypothetical protein